MSSCSISKVITPKEYSSLPNFSLVYGCTTTKFGKCLMAFHQEMLCYLSFLAEDEEPSIADLEKTWPNAQLTENSALIENLAEKVFNSNNKVPLYLKGTDFETSVWEALLKIKKGTTVSYTDIARAVGKPNAARAAGRAVGKNHIGYLVPCHRVINKDGSLHKYRWGAQRKLRMLKDEGAV